MLADRSRRPSVPDLSSGVTRLAGDDASAALRTIVADELAERDRTTSPAYWVDVGGVASSLALYEAGFDPESDCPARIARAFTAYQHVTLVERLAEIVSESTPLVVCSNVAALYDDDDLRREEARRLLEATASRLAEVADEDDVPLVFTTGACEDRRLETIVDGIADRSIRCRPTRMGVRCSGSNVETCAYESAWGDRQTTFEYWRAIASTPRENPPVDEWVEWPLEPRGPMTPGVG